MIDCEGIGISLRTSRLCCRAPGVFAVACIAYAPGGLGPLTGTTGVNVGYGV